MGSKSDDLIQQFARHLLDDGKSSKTVESYTGDVRGFCRYLEDVGTPFDGNLQRPHITTYRNHLMQEGYEPSTINKKINSLQAFNRYLVARGLMTATVVNLSRDRLRIAGGSERQIEVYPEEQLKRLLVFVNGNQVNPRDKAVVLTLLYTGVRVSELCGIRLKDIDLTSGYMTVMGKGGKVREVPLRPELIEALREYLTVRATSRFADSEFLFLGQRGPLQRDAINTLLERLTVRSGLNVRLKPHTFRHTFCTRLIQRGVPLTTVSKLAGHSNVETTARFYVNCSREEKMQAVNTL